MGRVETRIVSEDRKAVLRAAFADYRAAVVVEADAREAHYWKGKGPRPKSVVETDRALLTAIGRLASTRAALDHAILDAHSLTTAPVVHTGSGEPVGGSMEGRR